MFDKNVKQVYKTKFFFINQPKKTHNSNYYKSLDFYNNLEINLEIHV